VNNNKEVNHKYSLPAEIMEELKKETSSWKCIVFSNRAQLVNFATDNNIMHIDLFQITNLMYSSFIL